MKYLDLLTLVKQNIFTTSDVKKYFDDEKDSLLKTQLSRFVKKGLITKIKRGIYCFDVNKLDEFELANKIYFPSYISSESALNYYGIIPDVVQSVTSISLVNSKAINNQFGSFLYTKIKNDLFWGWKKVQLPQKESYILLAEKEKALLDFIYFRKIKNVSDLRLSASYLDIERYNEYCTYFPNWVKRVKLKI